MKIGDLSKKEILERLQGGIIVSVQAEENEPLGKPDILAAMARAVVQGGAVAIRTSGPESIRAVQDAVPVPVIGIYKRIYASSEVIITPTLAEALTVKRTGVPVLALDATQRPRPLSEKLEDIVHELKNDPALLLMADVSTLEEGVQAAAMGFNMIGTTLSGYTSYSRHTASNYVPDFALISELRRELGNEFPVIAEGRIWSPEDAVTAFRCGAFAVVVGSAITRPHLITARFTEALATWRKRDSGFQGFK
ncbi:MAG: N-acetylmannosamine-6-phosphate 2-epimerase [Calditrichaeota bacterium]|nr:N-acetylmannosamine-6-phosphate 2-epimerase [Calditrichota bacterium]RQW07285.1 MAG: N-acetylmannosamine-6-phosphate 2-epimerase [Calditrichota bacterium]